MAHVNKFWARLVAPLGNLPGDHAGDVTVYLIAPVEGRGEWVLPSDSVTVCAEQGALVGLSLELPGGRHMFCPGSNVLAVIDAPEDSGAKGGK
jgi:hypothetical protein